MNFPASPAIAESEPKQHPLPIPRVAREHLLPYPPASPNPRFYGLDFLRSFAMLLGVFGHAAMAYKTRGNWMPQEHARMLLLDYFSSIEHGFRMSLFFLMAGFFAHMVYHRDGPLRFLMKRLLRIGLPLLIACNTCGPLCHMLAYHAQTGIWHSPFFEWTWQKPINPLYLYHLWFLKDLLCYCVGILAIAPALRRLCPSKTKTAFDRGFAYLIQTWWVPVALALPIWFLVVSTEKLTLSYSNPLSTIGFWPNFGFFLVGWLLHRQRCLLEVLTQKTWLSSIGAALMLCLGWALAFGIARNPCTQLLLAATKVVFAWYACWFLVGFCCRYLNFYQRQIRYVVAASYWIYLVHLPIVYALQTALVSLNVGSGIKFALVSFGSLTISFLSYQFFVQNTRIGYELIRNLGCRLVRISASSGSNR